MSPIRMLAAIALALAITSRVSVADAEPIMHVHDSGGNLGTVDVSTGTVSVIGNMGVVMTDIAFDPSGDLFGISFNSLYSIDASTAVATLIGSHGVSGGNALVFSTDGTLYAAGFSTNSLFSIDPTTAASTNLGNMGFSSGGDLAFHEDDFYLASSASQLIKIDLADLTNTLAVGSFGVPAVFGLATGDDGILYAVAGTTIYMVDPTTGAAIDPVSFASQGLGQAFGQSFFAESGAGDGGGTPVPAPATVTLLSAAVAAIAVVRFFKS